MSDLVMSPDGTTVGYLAELQGTIEAYAVPVDGASAPARLHGTLPLGGSTRDVFEFQASPDGQSVAYLSNPNDVRNKDLFVTRADGRGPSVQLNRPLEGFDDVAPDFAFTLDGTRLVHRIGLQLFVGFSDGSQPLVLADGTTQRASLFRQTHDGLRVVYGSSGVGMFVQSLQGGPATPIAPDNPVEPVVTPDDSRVVYLRSGDLHSAALDGSGATLLHPTLPLFSEVAQFQIAPDSSRAVFLADLEVNGVYELYSSPVDGSQPAIKISGTMVAGGTVGVADPAFLITPDSSRVVWVADQETDDVNELYSAPIDGSAPRAKLSAPLVANGDVRPINGYLLTQGGASVLYRADQEVDERHELYVVPVDGSAAPVKLPLPLVAGGAVQTMQLDPSGTRVVYTADQEVDERFELFSVPLAGGQSFKVSGPMTFGGDVDVSPDGFAITPDGLAVVYLADEVTDRAIELFVGPIAGLPDAPARRRLSRALSDMRGITDFRVASDSSRAFHRGDEAFDGVFELFAGNLTHERLRAAQAPTRSVVR